MNPPAWVYGTRHMVGYSSMEGRKVAGVAAGVVAAGDVNSQPAQTGALTMQSPAMWAHIWFAIACLYLIGIYWCHVRIRPIS